MSTEDIIWDSLKKSYSDFRPVEYSTLISNPQSFMSFFYYLTKAMAPKRIFEWGPGQSTNIFLVADDNVTIDSYEKEKQWADLWYSQLIEKNPEWKDRINFIVEPMDSEYIMTDFPSGTFDMVLVDGHARERCMYEAERIARSQGIILCHDTQRPDFFNQVDRCLSKKKTKFVCNHALGQETTSVWIKL